MSTHYLVDLYGNPMSTASIIDVREPTNLQTITNGTFVIRVPDGAQIQRPTPTNLSALITAKFAGLLAFYAGFTRITFDDLIDPSGIDTSAPSTAGTFGQRGSIQLYPGGVLTSVVTPLTGGAPAQVVITWETFTLTSSDPKTDRFQRTYTEIPSSPSNVTCQVSFNGGVTFTAAMDGAVLNIPVPAQGTNFVIKLTNTSTGRLGIGSWAVIY